MATTKKATTKKVVAKKTSAKKATTKKVVAKGPSGPQVGDEAEGSVHAADVAPAVLAGKFGTGRDRDDALRQAGHDPATVQKETAKLRAAAKPEPTRLPIPGSRRGSSWT